MQGSLADGSCHLVVKSTFLEVTDGGMMKQYSKLRRVKSDSLVQHLLEEEVYTPGKFSNEQEPQVTMSSKASDSSTCPTPRDQTRAVRQSRAQPMERSEQRGRWHPRAACASTQAHSPDYMGRTTVMMRNLPNNYTRDMFVEMLNKHGFKGLYDFLYLPHDFDRNANLGYAFVNLVTADAVNSFWRVFDGFGRWSLPTAKVCKVSWSGPHQGLQSHVERYRNSPVMHKSVPDEYKPLVFKDGVRQPFPCPTRKVKPPPSKSAESYS